MLPAMPTSVGDNVAPPLRWSNVPAGTRSIAFYMLDPEGRGGAGVTHWVADGVDPDLGGFAEGNYRPRRPR